MDYFLQGRMGRVSKVMLADDDADDRELFEEAMLSINPEVSVDMAADGDEVLKRLLTSDDKPEVVFLDLNMPKKNGKECLVEIRENELLKGIPVIIYSTSVNPRDIEETFVQGANFFFRKPTSFSELKQGLEMLMEANFERSDKATIDSFLVGDMRLQH